MSEKPDSWMPLYVGDWDSSTRHLDVAEDGAYGRLVRHYWKNGPLSDENSKLARIVGVTLHRWKKMRPVLAEFFVIGNGVWTHKRIDFELEKSAAAYAKAVERARAGGKAKAAKERASSVLQARDKHAQSQSHSVEEVPTETSSNRGRAAPPSPREGEATDAPQWAGPADIRAIVVGKMGDPYARSYLDPCGWQDVPERMILTPGNLVADRLWRDFKRELSDMEISIGRLAKPRPKEAAA